MALLRRVVHSQQWLSRKLDSLLPEEWSVDGNRDFLDNVVPRFIQPGITVYDVGGGKNPYLSVERKQELGITVVGLDISASELAAAPSGAYDETICANICSYRGNAEADLVICQALLEHVPDVPAAMEAIASILRPGGVALLFVPSRNAIYARVNLMIPEGLKRRILYGVFPHTRADQGFPAYYHRCTPEEFAALARQSGLEPVDRKHYFVSSYFTFFFPAYALWRIWMLSFRALAGDQAAETFTTVARKQRSVYSGPTAESTPGT